MAERFFQPSRFPNSEVPDVANKNITAAQNFLKGSPVTLTGSPGAISEAAGTTTVDDLYGIALEDVVAGLSEGANANQVAVARANRDIEFLGQIAASAAVVAVAATDDGVQYGYLKLASGVWVVDRDDVTNVVLTVTAVLPEINCVLFKFLASTFQQ